MSTGDPIIRFSCVAINMVRSDIILSTNVTIDSAIIGLTAMVYVNGSAFVCFFLFCFLFRVCSNFRIFWSKKKRQLN